MMESSHFNIISHFYDMLILLLRSLSFFYALTLLTKKLSSFSKICNKLVDLNVLGSQGTHENYR